MKKIRIFGIVGRTYVLKEGETVEDMKQKFQDESVGSVLTDLQVRELK